MNCGDCIVKKMISRLLVAGLVAISLSSFNFNNFVNAESKMDSGIYFTNTNGEQGEFYDFLTWSKTSPIQQTNLILKYKPANISIYLDVTKEIALLSNVSSAGSFEKASKKYTDGDITGEYKDVSTGQIITGSKEDDFIVEGIE